MKTDRLPIWRRPIYASRFTAHLVFALFVWPALTIAGSTLSFIHNPYVWISEKTALMAALAGVLLSASDMLAVGVVFFGLSGLLFSRVGPATGQQSLGFVRLCLEPALVFVTALTGIALAYPAVLGSWLLAPIAALPVAAVIAVLCGSLAIGIAVCAAPGRRFHLAAALGGIVALAPVPAIVRSRIEPLLGHQPDIIVLGIDSVSQQDDVSLLRSLVDEMHGTWYDYAVAPGLLTNAVWNSILTMKPVSEHHVFHTFERPQGDGAASFLAAARARGYETVSIFPDQLTAAVGSRSGFDQDRSGAVGWRQAVLPVVANNSILLPILKPVFPRAWPSPSPPNQAGTFTYDLRREVRGILRAGSRGRRTLVAAHLTYTHLEAYPSSLDLSWPQRWAIARSPAALITDRGLDWQDVDRPSDPVPLQRWKLRHLEDVIRSEVIASGFLNAQRQLVIFSDHGHRLGLTLENFREERFHHVLLATFGTELRCPRRPISLIDIGALIGLTEHRAEPVVEFAMAPPSLWPQLMQGAQPRWAGDVDLDQGVLATVFNGLERYEPWQAQRDGCNHTSAAR